MKGLVESMGLKGGVIFFILIILAPKFVVVNPYLDVFMAILGAILLFVYLEEYFSKMKADITEKVTEDIAAKITEEAIKTKEFDTSLNNLTRCELIELKDTCMKDSCETRAIVIDKVGSLVDASSTEVIGEVGKIRKATIQEMESIKTNVTQGYSTLDKGIKNYRRQLDESLNLVKTEIESNVNESMTNNKTEIVKALNENATELSKSQENAINNLIDNLSNAFSSVDDNIGLLRNCLEENIKCMANLVVDTANNHEIILEALSKSSPNSGASSEIPNNSLSKEIIEDKENKVTIINTKKDGITIHSEMRENGQLAFMVGYDKGQMIFSKTFDGDGNITSETIYDSNGQVQERKTYLMQDGKISVEIDK